jgi:hypothetical protein
MTLAPSTVTMVRPGLRAALSLARAPVAADDVPVSIGP